jgi:NitT/TauT family transport system ATP-binding protein
MSDQSRHFLQVSGVSHTFQGDLQAISNINLSVDTGAFVALVGSSGVGKSTLLRILAGLLKPSEGIVTLNGGPPETTKDPIGIVFQRDNLMPWRTVDANIRLPLELQGVKKEIVNSRVSELIDLVRLGGFEKSFPAQLSGGMAQRVAIARALVHRPALLLLDEPFGSLDALTRERMGQELLHIWNALPVTVFMVTHSIPEAVLLSDEVLVMAGRPGTITASMRVELTRPRTMETQSSPIYLEKSTAIREAIAQDNQKKQVPGT